jgi:hypothetical protein
VADQPDLSAVHAWPGWARKTHLDRRMLAAQILWTLKLDGPLSGREAMAELTERLRRRGVDVPAIGRGGRDALTILSLAMAHQGVGVKGVMTVEPVLHREVSGRRTVALSVLDGVDLPPCPFVEEPAELEPEPVAVEEPEPVTVKRPEPVYVRTLADKAMLVMRLAGEVALGVAALPPGPVDDGVRLAEALAETERLRRQLAEEMSRRQDVEEQLASQRRVHDALKVQNETMQNNLDVAMRGQRRPDDNGYRQLDRMMREPAGR